MAKISRTKQIQQNYDKYATEYDSMSRDVYLWLYLDKPFLKKYVAHYLERGPRKVSLPWGMKVDLYHKTIGDILNAAVSAGFKIQKMEELVLPATLKKKFPKEYKEEKSHGATNLHIIFTKF